MFDYSNIVNLTPHAIDVLEKRDDDTYTTIVSIPPSGTIARLDQTTERIGMIGDIPITTTEFGEIEGLPPYDGNKKYIVSYPIAKQLGSNAFIRNDILIVNESVRDSEGKIIGCLSLAVYR